MKNTIPYFLSALGLAALLPASRAADDATPAAKSEKKELRVLAAPDDGHAGARSYARAFVTRAGGEKETVTFLGIETSPVSATLTAQLGLPSGAGLVVQRLMPDGPAASVLKEHDVLLKLDDQILVEQHQLSVLVRNRNEGEEVTLTYVRGAKQATAKVKLGKHEVQKISELFNQPIGGGTGALAFGTGAGAKYFETAPAPGSEGRGDVDRVLSMIESHTGLPTRVRIEHGDGGPGIRAIRVNTGNSNLVYSDDAGSLELTVKEEKKSLVAKDKNGTLIFSGPVTTPEERKALPDSLRGRLEKLEGMQDVTFRTDGDFKGAETTIVHPMGRGISLPRSSAAPLHPPLSF